jgi:hypothetical protein
MYDTILWSNVAASMTKESISRSYESMPGEGIRFGRRVFHAMFATSDRKECARLSQNGHQNSNTSEIPVKNRFYLAFSIITEWKSE